MCDSKVTNYYFNTNLCSGNYSQVKPTSDTIQILGRIKDIHMLTECDTLMYWAAAPPDYLSSFTGSGLPFSSPEQAFDNTPNKGIVHLNDDGSFSFTIHYPNAYYIHLGTTYVSPRIMFQLCSRNHSNRTQHQVIVLDDGIPFRRLTHKKKINLHTEDLPVRNQESIIRDKQYPKKTVYTSL
tara:strand:+ start:2290 stop:2835 length:546 start_codon:yes stop_codon:yes gene_type:complete